MKNIFQYITYSFARCVPPTILLLLYSCAQIVPLNGGEKDETPPKELASLPLNQSINFNAKEITIEFDEFIRLTNLNSQLIISPIIKPQPEITVKGKELHIQISDSLTPNTTYSFNFGSAITDITEFNPFLNYKYVFSTGSFLDSLTYAGTVVNAFDLTSQEKVYVMLYENNNDSIPLTELPKYVALTDKEGNYEMTNIAKGTYKVFALKDINSNYLFDLPNEEIGFKEELITLNTSQKENYITLFEEETQQQYLKKAENKQFGKIKVELNLPTTNLTFTPLEMKQVTPWHLTEKNKAGDSLTIWLTLKDEVEELGLVFFDENEVIDTTNIKIINELSDTVLTIQTNIKASFDLNKPITLTAKHPIAQLHIDAIELLEDSVPVNFKWKTTDEVQRKFAIDYPFKENTNYQLFIPPATFTSIYGLKNDTISRQFKTKEISDYGVIYLNLAPDFSDDYIVQLYRGKKLVRQNSYSDTQKITYNYLASGDYQFKLIIDKNNNKKWDTGNYLQHLQPEKVIYYKKVIEVRANWDNDISWIVK